MRSERGEAAVTEERGAPTPLTEKLAFLDAQLERARTNTGRLAAALAVACRSGAPPGNLEGAALEAMLAAGELRLALQARRLADPT